MTVYSADRDVGVVLFDLDGVLVDSIAAYRRAWSAWARVYRVDEALVWEDAHGRRPEDIIRRVTPNVAFDEALEIFSIALDEASGSVAPMAGARQLLDQLPTGRWAIVTSGQRRQVPSILRHARLPIPNVVVCGDDVSSGKPDPECFLLAARLLGTVASCCTVVEDSPAAIEAARSVGMHTVAVTTTHQSRDLVTAHRIFATLRDAAGHLLDRVGEPRQDSNRQ